MSDLQNALWMAKKIRSVMQRFPTLDYFFYYLKNCWFFYLGKKVCFSNSENEFMEMHRFSNKRNSLINPETLEKIFLVIFTIFLTII